MKLTKLFAESVSACFNTEVPEDSYRTKGGFCHSL